MLRNTQFFAPVLLSLLSFNIFATPLTRTIITSECLLKNVHASYQKIGARNAYTIINIAQQDIEALAIAKQANKKCGGFMDVTEEWQTAMHTPTAAKKLLTAYTTAPVQLTLKKQHYGIQYEKEVNELFTHMNPDKMWADLTALTQFTDRYANSDSGVAAANWLKAQIEAIAGEYNRKDVTSFFVPTGNVYQQPSLVVKIGDSDEPGIVIGAHMDTLSSRTSIKPGADDDGSGTVTALQAARMIMQSQLHFKKPIYFIWYAAEEEGMVGSKYVVNEFKEKNIPVANVLQLDMTGYAHQNDPTIWLIDDNVNTKLTDYLQTLINTYIHTPFQYTSCGYACSDHVRWNNNGYPVAFPFEAAFGNDNPDIHTSRDTIDKLSLTHMSDFAKLATAFAVELAEPAV